MARPPLMRPGPTRVETYCSKVFLKVPCWRRSNDSTAGSCCTPPSAALTTFAEMPAACASADMLETKLPKSPPQRAANAGAAPPTDAADNAIAPSRARVRAFMCESLFNNLARQVCHAKRRIVKDTSFNPRQIQNFKQRFESPRPACGERSDRPCDPGEGASPQARSVESPPHPDPLPASGGEGEDATAHCRGAIAPDLCKTM